MTPVYYTDNSIEAQLVADWLGRGGLRAYVRGVALLGAVGELPPCGLVQVWVEDVHAALAREQVLAWQQAPVPADEELEALADAGATEVYIRA